MSYKKVIWHWFNGAAPWSYNSCLGYRRIMGYMRIITPLNWIRPLIANHQALRKASNIQQTTNPSRRDISILCHVCWLWLNGPEMLVSMATAQVVETTDVCNSLMRLSNPDFRIKHDCVIIADSAGLYRDLKLKWCTAHISTEFTNWWQSKSRHWILQQGEGGNQGFIHELMGARLLTPGGTPVFLDHHLLFIHIFINQSMSVS